SVLIDPKASMTLVLAGEEQASARAVAVLQPRLIEERRLHAARTVGDDRLDERLHPAPAHRPRRDRANLDDDGRDLVRLHLVERGGRAPIARQMLEQVADREQPEPLRSLRRLLPGLRVQWRIEPRRPRIARGTRLLRERVAAGEGGR